MHLFIEKGVGEASFEKLQIIMMDNFLLGIICILSGAICLLAKSEKPNSTLGFKNPFDVNPEHWKARNKIIGILLIIGGGIYIVIQFVICILDLKMFDFQNEMNVFLVIYIVISMIATEIYIHKNKR